MDFDKLGLNAYATPIISIKRFQMEFLSSLIDISHYWKDQNLLGLFNVGTFSCLELGLLSIEFH